MIEGTKDEDGVAERVAPVFLKEEVNADDIAEVVARWTRHTRQSRARGSSES